MDPKFDFENSNLIGLEGFESIVLRREIFIIEMWGLEVDAHKRHHCSILEPKLIRE